jgi:DNA-binding NtrC family response regulator
MYRKKIGSIKPNVLEAMYSSQWKGNIRELANILERGVLLSENETLTLDCLNIEYRSVEKSGTIDVPPLPLKQVVEEAERKAIVQALKAANNNRSQAAQLLGISRRAFYDKLAQYDLDTSSLQ